jgi:hypothetical protein
VVHCRNPPAYPTTSHHSRIGIPARLSALSLTHSWHLLQAYYYDGVPSISNEEFDLLKDELTWQGSKLAVLRYGACPRSC